MKYYLFWRVLFGVIAVIIFLSRAFVLLLGTIIIQPAQTITWKLQDPALVGNFSPAILGNPLIIKDATGTSLFFNGVNDGLILPTIPIDGWPRFTIEVLFKPASDGPPAPGFIHFQDKDANRGTVEIRGTPKGDWYLDTFLKNGKTNEGLPLIDSTKLREGDNWYWAAMEYDEKK